MPKSIQFLTTLSFIFFFIACEKEIEFRPKYQRPFLVMNSYLNPDSIWKVSIDQSVSIMDKLISNFVTDAVVNVYEKETLIETLHYNSKTNKYDGTGKPLVGRVYKVTVMKNGFLPIEATTVIESAPEILNINITKDNNGNRASVNVTFKEKAGVKNFYRLVVANEDEFNDLPSWASNYHNTSSSGWIGKKFVNYLVDIRTNDPSLLWHNQSSSAGFFDDVPNNIFNIFNDELIEGKSYSLSFSYSLSEYGEANNYTVIYLQAITEELHLYLKTLSAQYYFGDDPLLEPIQVYSNVKNGGGILGSYNSNKLIIKVDDLVSTQH